MKIKRILPLILVMIGLYGCQSQSSKKQNSSTLKTSYNDAFLIGTALNRKQIYQVDSLETDIIKNQFNSITAENIMKSSLLHPKEDSFFFDDADKFVELGEAFDMNIHGHTLIWHSQLAPWFKSKKDSVSMRKAMAHHIKTIVGRYKGRVHSWDVVNEALNEDGTLRSSAFLSALGENYLIEAFEMASKVDNESTLYYNDYNLTNKEKRAGAIRLVEMIQNQGVKIDGIGMQGHWHLDSPSLDDIEKSIIDYSKLGIKVAITELDISVLPNPWGLVGAEISQRFENNERMNPYPDKLPDSIQKQLANRYKDIFKIFLKHKDKISRVTFWGVQDGQSWLNNFPIRGRTNYPLLFDRENQPKQAFDSIIALKP